MDFYYDKIINSIPDTPILIGRDKNFRSAVFVPFIKVNDTECVLFEKRAQGIRQAGEICFPGGMIDKNSDSSSEKAAIRETVEELGISEDKIRIDKKLGYLVSNIGATIDVFIGRLEITSLKELTINTKEVESIHAVPFRFFIETKPDVYRLETEIKPVYYDEKGNKTVLFPALELGLPQMYHAPWSARKVNIYVYRNEEITIWGLTASIMHELTEIPGRED